MRRVLSGLLAVPVLLLGAATALATVAVHGHWWGLLLGLAATVATTIALPPGWTRRVAWAAGWVAMVGYLAVPRSEGDYVIAGDLAGYAVLITAAVVALGALATLPGRSSMRTRLPPTT
ncbi:hypothetical protein GHK92_07745 [Nocardioides sp. dk4132]|uniref:hypothetical protein n=1 Tax=unclassified Nocardioides TaxID=2615069 RepID=UPI00129605D3|nr:MULTISPECIES: hypothetical protein [unclassified Nocardioides]MQW75762.1 hypothetical protein [Nocardioides sp. dk4132]QGA08644.1 hypothetical protein GFH29_15495 [Nocardioides sp. dk884]